MRYYSEATVDYLYSFPAERVTRRPTRLPSLGVAK